MHLVCVVSWLVKMTEPWLEMMCEPEYAFVCSPTETFSSTSRQPTLWPWLRHWCASLCWWWWRSTSTTTPRSSHASRCPFLWNWWWWVTLHVLESVDWTDRKSVFHAPPTDACTAGRVWMCGIVSCIAEWTSLCHIGDQWFEYQFQKNRDLNYTYHNERSMRTAAL